MTQNTVFCAGMTPAIAFAGQFLRSTGVIVASEPSWDTKHLLLDVPSFRPGVWSEDALYTLLSSLPRDVLIWGGNLSHPALAEFRTIDLLQDEEYLTENAAITARCTMQIAEPLLKLAWDKSCVLLIGWGRISKQLAPLLKRKGCDVFIASRTEAHRREIQMAGYISVSEDILPDIIKKSALLINTAPAQILSEQELCCCRNCLKIDLASIQGIAGDDVIWARALPGRCAPEESGKLIARTFLRIRKELIP